MTTPTPIAPGALAADLFDVMADVRPNAHTEDSYRDAQRRAYAFLRQHGHALASLLAAPEPAAMGVVEALAPDYLMDACERLNGIVEGGTWGPPERWESFGTRLKDTKQWVNFYIALRNARDARKAPPAPAAGEAVAGMLPDELGPVSAEWYELCERAPYVGRIKISGDLASAIVETVVRLNRHPAPAPAAAEWRPIESAPRDGTVVEITDGVRVERVKRLPGELEPPKEFTAAGGRHYKWWPIAERWALPGGSRSSIDSAATHWRPSHELPTPPSLRTGEGE